MLKYTTKDLFCILETLLPSATRQDEANYVKICIGNFYHEICHRYIHAGEEKSRNKLRTSSKHLYFEKTYTAVIDWCQKAFARIK